MLVGSTIGSGIFRVPSAVAGNVGTVGAVALLWMMGGVVALLGALTLAELAVLFPRSGGIYVFLREAYGPLPAFLFGWTELLVIRPSALGAIAIVFAEYLGEFVRLGAGGVRLVAAGAILLLAAANMRSLSWGAAVQNVSTAAKVLALVGFALLVFAVGDPQGGAFARPVAVTPLSWSGFGIALVAVMWAYDGWADLTFLGGEVKDPARTLPRALLGGTAAIVVVYLLVNAAYLHVLTIEDMTGRPLVAADAARAIMTTDTFPKGASAILPGEGGEIRIAGIAKGSGMIAPDMATMLVYLFTDAKIAPDLLQQALSSGLETTFNAITVDSDTSTSDALILAATNQSTAAPISSLEDVAGIAFVNALHDVMRDLAHQVVRDGEGATKFVEIRVTGAVSDAEARTIAMSIANSPLVKTAIAGEDANWGRIVAAVGKSGAEADRDRLTIRFGDMVLAENGWRAPDYDEAKTSAYMKNQDLLIGVDLGLGQGSRTVWTCDLTHGYIDINADYRS